MHNPSIIQGLGWVILLFLYILQVTQETAVPIKRMWVLPQMAVAQGLGPDLPSCVTLPHELASPGLGSLIRVGWSNATASTSQGDAWHTAGPASCQHLSEDRQREAKKEGGATRFMWPLFRNSYKMRDFCLLSPQKEKTKTWPQHPPTHLSKPHHTVRMSFSEDPQGSPGEQTTLYIGLRGNAMGPGQNTSPL